jgi:hypothetical protein
MHRKRIDIDLKKKKNKRMCTLIIRVSVVRLSLERFKSMGTISSCPFIITGIEQMIVLLICSSSMVSVKRNFELEQDMTQE